MFQPTASCHSSLRDARLNAAELPVLHQALFEPLIDERGICPQQLLKRPKGSGLRLSIVHSICCKMLSKVFALRCFFSVRAAVSLPTSARVAADTPAWSACWATTGSRLRGTVLSQRQIADLVQGLRQGPPLRSPLLQSLVQGVLQSSVLQVGRPSTAGPPVGSDIDRKVK